MTYELVHTFLGSVLIILGLFLFPFGNGWFPDTVFMTAMYIGHQFFWLIMLSSVLLFEMLLLMCKEQILKMIELATTAMPQDKNTKGLFEETRMIIGRYGIGQ